MNATPEQVLRSAITTAEETAALLRQLAMNARELAGPYNLVLRWEAERMERKAVEEDASAAAKRERLDDLLHPERAAAARESLRALLGGGRTPSGELT
jgi:hypothetical protein